MSFTSSHARGGEFAGGEDHAQLLDNHAVEFQKSVIFRGVERLAARHTDEVHNLPPGFQVVTVSAQRFIDRRKHLSTDGARAWRVPFSRSELSLANKPTLTLTLSRPTGEGTARLVARSFQSGWIRRPTEDDSPSPIRWERAGCLPR